LKDLQVDVPNILSVSEMRTHQPVEDHEIATFAKNDMRQPSKRF